ncbi:MAG: class I SAM-dependent methyltransferase [Mycobacterium sp.]
MSELAVHWDDAYGQGETSRSWFQTEPVMSLRMIDGAGVSTQASVVDIGGGTSRLVDALLARGHDDLTVVDVSDAALRITQDRLGGDAAEVHWVNADIRTWSPGRVFDLWHDRAVVHFLNESADQDAYRNALNAASRPGSVAVFGCFAADGPTHCSGLPVVRRDVADLVEFLGPQWTLVARDREMHPTPGGATQPFTWAAFVRR